MEIFTEIKGYEELYFISNAGRVYSIHRRRVLTHYENKKGYLFASLNKDRRKRFSVHRLVAEHFLPEGHTQETVNHKDFDRTNNYDWNLEWATNLENIQHAARHGKMRGGSKRKFCGDAKVCKKCKTEKPLDKFGNGKGIGGKNSQCIECENGRLREYYKNNREKFLKKYNAKRRYNSKFGSVLI